MDAFLGLAFGSILAALVISLFAVSAYERGFRDGRGDRD